MKKQLRETTIEKRKSLDSKYLKVASKIICSKILTMQKELNLANLGLYYPIKNEVDVKELFEKNLLVYVKGNSLGFSQIEGDFKKNAWGIYEVKNTKPSNPCAIIIPALLYNYDGYRLGYGGGYYDRYIKVHPQVLKIGVSLDKFLTNLNFEEAHDEKVDYIVTEKRIIKIDD